MEEAAEAIRLRLEGMVLERLEGSALVRTMEARWVRVGSNDAGIWAIVRLQVFQFAASITEPAWWDPKGYSLDEHADLLAGRLAIKLRATFHRRR